MHRATEHPGGPHHPPTTGKFVGDHWTPYEPPDPESFPPGSQVHIIERGDTLWDLAGRFLTNAWLWPQIWDVNQYITDSHWIYPGDPLLIPGQPVVIGEAEPQPAPAGAETPAQPEPEPQAEPEPAVAETAPPPVAPPAPPALQPIATESDIYCSNYIAADWQPPALFIEEREEGGKTILSTGDVVFLSQGAEDGVSAGQLFSVVTPEHEVVHPIRAGDDLGTSVRSLGRLRVIAVQPRSATAEIVESCSAISVGDFLVPFEEVAVPLSGPVAFERYGVTLTGEHGGFIVHELDDRLSFGQGDLVNIDLGTEDGVEPGDIFTVYREWGGEVVFASPASYIEGQQARAEELKATGEEIRYSQVILGQLVVIGTQDRSATAKVIVSVREMAVGDRIELR